MPQAINLIIKNAAAADKTFTLGSPATDGNIADWALREGLTRDTFVRVTALARPTGDKGRKCTVKLTFPYTYTDPATNLTKVGSVAYGEISTKTLDSFPENLRDDFIAYLTNAAANALLKSMLRDGSSAT